MNEPREILIVRRTRTGAIDVEYYVERAQQARAEMIKRWLGELARLFRPRRDAALVDANPDNVASCRRSDVGNAENRWPRNYGRASAVGAGPAGVIGCKPSRSNSTRSVSAAGFGVVSSRSP